MTEKEFIIAIIKDVTKEFWKFPLMIAGIMLVLWFSMEVEERTSKPEIKTSTPFIYPLENPYYMRHEGFILAYEWINDNKHIVVVKDGDSEYIMPFFDSKDQALNFMNAYFQWYLKNGVDNN